MRKRWEKNNNINRFSEIVKNTSTGSTSDNLERTKFRVFGCEIDAPNVKTASWIGVAASLGVAVYVWWKSDRKKSEDNNKSNNKIKVDNNKSENKIKEDNNQSANKIKESSACTDDKITFKKFEYEQKMELERLKHEQWKDKGEYKNAKTCLVLPEIATHPLLSEVDIKPKSHKLNYYGSEEVEQTQELYENLIYKNETTIFFSPTNVGKTFASIQIGAEISEKFPDAHTLYYNQEMSDPQLQTLLFGSNKRPKYAENMDIISDICTEEELIKDMVLNIELYRKDMTIFIDNITDLHPSSRNEKATEFLKLLKRIRINAKRIYGINLTYVIICHTNKIEKNSRLELDKLKGNANLNNFADRIIAIGRVINHNDKRYFKVLKGRTGAVDSDLLMIFKIVADKPRFRHIGYANEEDLFNGKYKEPKLEIPENVAEKWYQDNLAGIGYGTIAREYYKLEIISDNDSDEVKSRKKAEFERCKNKVRNEIEKYKKTLKQSA